MVLTKNTSARTINGTTYMKMPKQVITDSAFKLDINKKLDFKYNPEENVITIREAQNDRERNEPTTKSDSNNQHD